MKREHKPETPGGVFFSGPMLFHPTRGMGPRGMRAGMRPPFPPRGQLFDPREPDAFFRPPFDEMRGRPGYIRPPFGPPGMHAPDGPWRNQEGSGPSSSSWGGQEHDNYGQWDNHPARDKQKFAKHQDYKNMPERENRNRNRKSRWGNVSPPLTDDVDEMPSEENKTTGTSEGQPTKESTVEAPSQQNLLREDESTADKQDVMRDDRESELANLSNDKSNIEASYGHDRSQSGSYESGTDHFSSDALALTQQRGEEQCEYEPPIPAEDSAQQSAVEEVGHASENCEQLVEQADSL